MTGLHESVIKYLDELNSDRVGNKVSQSSFAEYCMFHVLAERGGKFGDVAISQLPEIEAQDLEFVSEYLKSQRTGKTFEFEPGVNKNPRIKSQIDAKTEAKGVGGETEFLKLPLREQTEEILKLHMARNETDKVSRTDFKAAMALKCSKVGSRAVDSRWELAKGSFLYNNYGTYHINLSKPVFKSLALELNLGEIKHDKSKDELAFIASQKVLNKAVSDRKSVSSSMKK